MGQRQIDGAERVALRNPALVLAAIADALGLQESKSEAPLELLVRHIGGTDRLLVLDSLEQLLPGASATRALGGVAVITVRGAAFRLSVTCRPCHADPRLHLERKSRLAGRTPRRAA